MTPIEELVKHLADEYKYNWTRMISERDAADHFLGLLAEAGFIEQRQHPSGGKVWKVGKKLYGRTDGVTLDLFK